MKRLAAGVALCGLLLLVPGSSGAGPHRMFGYDSWSIGTSGSQYTRGSGVGVLFSNPALLSDLKDQFGVGYMLVCPRAEARLMDKPANADVPITFYDSDVGIEGSNLLRPLPTAELPNERADNLVDDVNGYLSIGFAHSLGTDFLTLGLSVLVPSSGLASINSYFPDEREQYFSNTVHFTRFGEFSQILSFMAGAAYKPLPWMSVGASVEGSLYAGVVLNAYVPEATVQDFALANLEMDASPAIRGVVGFNFRPLDWLSLSLVWRDRRYSKIDADAILNLWNYHETGDTTVPKRVKQNHLLALDFEPMEVTLAAGVSLMDFTAELGVTWNHWSDYLDPHHQRAQETAVSEPTNPDDELVDGGRFEFSDTWSLSAAGSYNYLKGFTATVGFGYRPSPVPAQVGRTNYVDNDVITASLGHRFDFSLWERKLQVDVGLQFAYLFDATVHKDPALIRDEFADRAKTLIGGQPMAEAEGLQTNNPGFPGYEFGGWAISSSVSLAYLF